jgi:hypothetical protein
MFEIIKINNRFIKILTIISFLTITTTLLIIATIPCANGYEISLYSMYPWYFWILIAIPIINPIIYLGFHKWLKNPKTSYIFHFFILGTALLSLLIFLSLPYFRGYLCYTSGDAFSHLGFTKDIINTGHIGKSNFYPITHILLLDLTQILGISLSTPVLFFPQIFLTIYVISMYILSRSLKFDSLESLSITVLAIVPILGVEIAREFILPSFSAFCMVPLTFYLLIKSKSSDSSQKYSILLVILLILLPFFHLEIAIFILILFFIIQFVFLLSKRYKIKWSDRSIVLKKGLFNEILILSICFIFWFSITVQFEPIIKMSISAFFSNIPQSPVNIITDSFRTTLLTLPDIFMYIVKMYGVLLISFLITGTLAIITLSRLLRKKDVEFSNFSLSLSFFIFSFILLILLFKDWIFGISTRMFKFPVFISTIIMGTFLARKYFKHDKLRSNLLICSLLIIFIVLVLLNTYPSPLVNLANREVDYSIYSGMSFFLINQDRKIPTIEVQTRLWNYKEVTFGIDYLKENFQFDKNYYREGLSFAPPGHFGYNTSHHLGYFYNGDRYLLINQLAKVYYPSIYQNYPQLWTYTPQDFNQLYNDTSVNVIFDSTNLDVFYIYSMD